MKISEQDRIDIILSYEEGVSVEELAKIYGVSNEAIRKYVRAVGKPYFKQVAKIESKCLSVAKKLTKAEVEEAFVDKLKALVSNGVSHAHLIKLYGLSVRYYLKRHNIETEKDNRRDGFAVELTYKNKFYKCKSVVEAAKISGYSQSAISNALAGRYRLEKANVKYAD